MEAEKNLIAELISEGCKKTVANGRGKNAGKVNRFFEDAAGVLQARDCTQCGTLKRRDGFSAKKAGRGGIRAECRECLAVSRAVYYEQNADRERVNGRKWYANPENRESDIRRSAEWSKDNPERKRVATANRRAKVATLPNDITAEQYAMICDHFGNECALTGTSISSGRIQMEHFIAVATGHGGTILELCYPMRSDLNQSKSDRNPFEWYIENSRRFNISPVKWERLTRYMADMNGMEPLEFREYVYNVYEYRDAMEQRHTPSWDDVAAISERGGVS